MKALAALPVLLALLAVPAAADDTPGAPPETTTSAAPSRCAAASTAAPSLSLAPALPLIDFGASSYCSAQATCEDGSTISCSCTSTSCSCDAVDQDCANGVSGYVACGWDEDICDPCPPDCSAPSVSKCIDGHVCEPGCSQCGPGSCLHGTCNCLA